MCETPERSKRFRRGRYLAREEDFELVRSLEMANRVVPVVGNLAGGHAVRPIGREHRRRGLRASVVHAPNVEFYVRGQGPQALFAANVAAIPARRIHGGRGL